MGEHKGQGDDLAAFSFTASITWGLWCNASEVCTSEQLILWGANLLTIQLLGVEELAQWLTVFAALTEDPCWETHTFQFQETQHPPLVPPRHMVCISSQSTCIHTQKHSIGWWMSRNSGSLECHVSQLPTPKDTNSGLGQLGDKAVGCLSRAAPVWGGGGWPPSQPGCCPVHLCGPCTMLD